MDYSIELFLQIVATTDMAILVTDGVKEAWLPRSTIDGDPMEFEVGQSYQMTIKSWIAEKKGFV